MQHMPEWLIQQYIHLPTLFIHITILLQWIELPFLHDILYKRWLHALHNRTPSSKIPGIHELCNASLDSPCRVAWLISIFHGRQDSDKRASDLAFLMHCNLMSALMLVQYAGGMIRVEGHCCVQGFAWLAGQ